jgi:hypothetical protein
MRWRMGGGEDVRCEFWKWYSGLTDEQAEQFALENPEPEGWHGDYALIRANPWIDDA